MSTRVLSTDEAKTSISQIQSILSGAFLSSIQQLETQGQKLSDPNVWDGQLATTFRSETWPNCSTALKNAHQQLEQLQQDLSKIAQNIMTAGGNG